MSNEATGTEYINAAAAVDALDGEHTLSLNMFRNTNDFGVGSVPMVNGQVDLVVFVADDHHLRILTLGQMGADVADVGIGYFGNMYHTGLILRQRYKCAEVGDGFDFAL